MPTYNRQTLRRLLGTSHLRDTHVSTTTHSWNQAGGSVQIIDGRSSDLSLSGHGLYAGSWLKFGDLEFRVASFNVASGAYLSQGAVVGMVASIGQNGSGAGYERHDMLSPSDKDRALDEAVKRVRVRREVTINGVDGLTSYSLSEAIIDVFDAFYWADPTATLDRGRRSLVAFEPVRTATMWELRISPPIGSGAQLVIDAMLIPRFDPEDTATVNIPDERLVLYGAEAQCWDLMVRKAPRGTADEYRRLRDEAARQFSLLASRYKVPIDRPLRLEENY